MGRRQLTDFDDRTALRAADVTYKVSGGAGAPAVYPIKAKGTATFSDSVIDVDRIRIANERAMRENLKQFLEALR